MIKIPARFHNNWPTKTVHISQILFPNYPKPLIFCQIIYRRTSIRSPKLLPISVFFGRRTTIAKKNDNDQRKWNSQARDRRKKGKKYLHRTLCIESVENARGNEKKPIIIIVVVSGIGISRMVDPREQGEVKKRISKDGTSFVGRSFIPVIQRGAVQ